jgi:hypothetical protein
MGGDKVGFIDKIKRIMQGFKNNKETDLISEDESNYDNRRGTNGRRINGR